MCTLDVIIIVAYMAVLVSVGVRLSRRQNTTDEYFLAKLEGRVFSRGELVYFK
jgi:Na+/proline symporter